MDSLTHLLFGATLGQAGFRQKLGRRALVAGAVIASLPDFDVAAGWIGGHLAEWEHHRGFTHSFFFAPVAGPVLGWAIARAERWTIPSPAGAAAGTATGDDRLRWWIWFSILGLLSNSVLDVLTAYGTQILWPLSTTRFAVNALAIIDPVYSLLPLLIALLIGAFARPRVGRFAARAVFAWMALYAVFAWNLNEKVERIAAEDFGRPAVVTAYPLLFQPYYQRVLAMTPEAAHVGYYSLLNPKPIAWTAYAIDHGPAIEAVRRSREGAVFEWFAMDRVLWRATPDGRGGMQVEASDLRYGMPGPSDTGFWGFRTRVDGAGGFLDPPQPFTAPRDASAAAFRAFWSELTGR